MQMLTRCPPSVKFRWSAMEFSRASDFRYLMFIMPPFCIS